MTSSAQAQPEPPQPAAGDRYRPARGDDVEAFIRRRRGEYPRGTDGWHALDNLLDDYREKADTGTPLSGEAGHA